MSSRTYYPHAKNFFSYLPALALAWLLPLSAAAAPAITSVNISDTSAGTWGDGLLTEPDCPALGPCGSVTFKDNLFLSVPNGRNEWSSAATQSFTSTQFETRYANQFRSGAELLQINSRMYYHPQHTVTLTIAGAGNWTLNMSILRKGTMQVIKNSSLTSQITLGEVSTTLDGETLNSGSLALPAAGTLDATGTNAVNQNNNGVITGSGDAVIQFTVDYDIDSYVTGVLLSAGSVCWAGGKADQNSSIQCDPAEATDQGIFLTGTLVPDTDSDGIADAEDNCPSDANIDQLDTDIDDIGNVCDSDDDGDSDNDGSDNCPLIANPDQLDTDMDGTGDACDTNLDTDGDSIDDGSDNCPLVTNPDQLDTDDDGLGDACDTDNDNDGVVNGSDNCPLDANSQQLDSDGDNQGDACDTDDDGDTVLDGLDNCPLVANLSQTDTDTDGIGNACDSTPTGDTDGDGVDNATDNCPNFANLDQLDTDSDGTGDACDNTLYGDTDGDGEGNDTDNCPTVSNVDQLDTDNDGVGDACDAFPDEPGVLMRSWGEMKRDTFGSAVANAGDVNHDGHDDVIVGAYHWNVSKSPSQAKTLKDAGKVYVYSGLDGAVLHTFQGGSAGDWFGYSVAGADINGDGYADIVVGAYRDDVLDGVTNKRLKDAGSIYIYSGQTGDLLTSFHGTASGDNLGFAVANAGDVDGDGKMDVIYGVPKADPDSLSNAGIAVVRSGANGSELFHINGTVAGDLLGRAVHGAGDVNADGKSDVIVGMPKDDAIDLLTSKLAKDAGTAAIYSGANGTQLFHMTGESAGDWFGSAVAGAGDLNEDGRADVVVGAHRHDALSTMTNKKMKDAGAVYAYSGIDGSLLFKVSGQAKGDWLGYSVASGEDLDNDGDADIVAGAHRYDRINPMTGKWLRDAGAVYGIDGAGDVLFVITGRSKKDYYGQALACAGDLDIDGHSDIITSTPQADRQDPATMKMVKDMGMMEVMSGAQAMAED